MAPDPTNTQPPQHPPPAAFDPNATTRPDPLLLKHYLIVSLLTGPFFPFVFLPAYCRYATLRYRFDDEGVWMAWGVLFKREINLAYRRIQDINVTRGLIQRWVGLASVSVQTASGSATPEMTIEGVPDADGLRDFLYAKMRGSKGLDTEPASGETAASDELLGLLTDIRDGIGALRERVETLETARGGEQP
ncbi:hypothetical protein MNBD_PLANCTO03-135 [hydrothermal vent metagenome]|uniref:YdbS-like PH domain-containing protein n=1 Tax=hydrothermal vent metagenome TaxID=652676 RepID=A0A3B1DKB6_9ZZZZ